jgi:hypothetical protein
MEMEVLITKSDSIVQIRRSVPHDIKVRYAYYALIIHLKQEAASGGLGTQVVKPIFDYH